MRPLSAAAPGPAEAEAEAAPAPEAAEAMAAPGVPHCPGGVPGGGTDRDREAARLLRLAEAGAVALAADDPDLDAERAVMAEYYAAEPSDRPYAPGDPDRLRDGLLAGARGWVLSGGGGMRAAGAPDLARLRTQ